MPGKKMSGRDVFKKPYTSCEILIPRKTKEEEDKCIGYGIVVLAKGDIFIKEKGRRRSFSKAIKDSGLDKPTRTKLWEAFRTITKEPKWPKPVVKKGRLV